MKASILHENQTYQIDLSRPLNISIPLREGMAGVNAFYAPLLEIEPVRSGSFVGDTREGGLLNFKTIKINPHGNGTHTECVGHIAKKIYNLGDCLKTYFFMAKVITVYPQKMPNGDRIILKEQIENTFLTNKKNDYKSTIEALIIRTMPNDDSKLNRHYSGTNPPYLDVEATKYIVKRGIKHLLLDLPSVDREQDEGKLLSHKAFWQYPDRVEERLDCTISELIYVPNEIKDDIYLLNMMVTSLELDASPSQPILYQFE